MIKFIARNKFVAQSLASNCRVIHAVPFRSKSDYVPDFKQECKELKVVWPLFKEDILDFTREQKIHEKEVKLIDNLLDYNCIHGKLMRGSTMMAAFKTFAQNYSKKELEAAHAVAWVMEMIHAAGIMQDDIMDGSQTRRGQPCWHTMESVGLNAINDSMIIYGGFYYLIEKYFSQDSERYTNVMKVVNRTIFSTYLGQSMDLKSGHLKFNEFSEKYRSLIAKMKTSLYTIELPISVAMHLAGLKDETNFKKAHEISMKIGDFFQIQDDFLDVYGDPKITGKIGTDIQDNKCSWLAAYANENGTKRQREILAQCYGHHEVEKVQKVREIFEEMKIQEAYKKYEKKEYESILAAIEKLNNLPKDIFMSLLNTYNQRQA